MREDSPIMAKVYLDTFAIILSLCLEIFLCCMQFCICVTILYCCCIQFCICVTILYFLFQVQFCTCVIILHFCCMQFCICVKFLCFYCVQFFIRVTLLYFCCVKFVFVSQFRISVACLQIPLLAANSSWHTLEKIFQGISLP